MFIPLISARNIIQNSLSYRSRNTNQKVHVNKNYIIQIQQPVPSFIRIPPSRKHDISIVRG